MITWKIALPFRIDVRRYRSIRVLGVLCLLCVAGRVRAQDGVLPRDLQFVADSLGCRIVKDFYSRTGMIEPPYVYGISSGEKESSAAFWCSGDTSDRALLILVESGRSVRRFQWWNPPGGLSLTEVPEVELMSFRRLSDPEMLGPAVTLRNARALKSEYDGVYTLFILANGEVYYRVFH